MLFSLFYATSVVTLVAFSSKLYDLDCILTAVAK